MYVRVNSLRVVRVGRKFSKMSTLMAIMLSSLAFLLFLALISPDVAKTGVENDVNYRRAELATWRINQSVMLEDYIDLSDPHSFLIEPTRSLNDIDELSPFCGPRVKMLILVASAPPNFVARNAIRESWGARKTLAIKGGRILFFLGRSDNSTLDNLVAEEAAKYEDIVVEDFHDTYHNLTLKSLSMLKWVNLTCTRNNVTEFPQHVLKTDDDIYINVDRLLRVTEEMKAANLFGRLTCGALPIGDASSKLYMPKYLFPGRVYPGYLSGTAYVLKSDIIPTLLENTFSVPLIHLEDIYVTGLLARHSNIYPVDSPFFTYNRLEPKDLCAFKYMVNSHQMKPQEVREIHASVQQPPSIPCNLKKAKWLRRIPRMTKRYRNLCLFN